MNVYQTHFTNSLSALDSIPDRSFHRSQLALLLVVHPGTWDYRIVHNIGNLTEGTAPDWLKYHKIWDGSQFTSRELDIVLKHIKNTYPQYQYFVFCDRRVDMALKPIVVVNLDNETGLMDMVELRLTIDL